MRIRKSWVIEEHPSVTFAILCLKGFMVPMVSKLKKGGAPLKIFEKFLSCVCPPTVAHVVRRSFAARSPLARSLARWRGYHMYR